MAAGYKAQPIEELDMKFSYLEYEASFAEGEGRFHKIIRLLTFNGLLLPAKRNNVTSMVSCRPINFYRAKRVLQYDVTSGKAFVTEKSAWVTMMYLIYLLRMTSKIMIKFNKAESEFRNMSSLLASEDQWVRYLQI